MLGYGYWLLKYRGHDTYRIYDLVRERHPTAWMTLEDAVKWLEQADSMREAERETDRVNSRFWSFIKETGATLTISPG